MNHKNRNSLLIAPIIVLMLAMLACISPAAPMMLTQTPPIPTEAGEAGGVSPTDTPLPTLTDAPASTEIPVTDTPAPTVCTFDAGFVADVTIPDDTVFLPNTDFVKIWLIRNTGCDWGEGMKLVYVSGDLPCDESAVDVPPTAAGDDVQVQKDFTSPASPGTYRSNWRMQSPDGTLFGQQFYVQIVVVLPTSPPTDTPVPTVPTATSPPTNTPPPSTKPVGNWPTVQQGDEGPEVYAIQYLLWAEGYSPAADGKFGSQTKFAVESFQGTKGLAVDGIVGPNTWQAFVQDKTVKAGNSGNAVLAVQHLLKYKHGYDVTVDGMFGRGTDAAVRDLQKTYGLVVDGIVEKNTWKALVAGL